MTWLAGDGGVVRFVSESGRKWEAESGAPYRLFSAQEPGWKRVVHPDGVESVFDADGLLGWAYHEVVVKDGRVFDLTTGHKGLSIDEYKQLWQYFDAIDSGF
jgi:hypothetical protein